MLIAAFSLVGCNFDEGILETEIKGKLVVPVEAATLEYTDANGDLVTLVDAKNIGPVYLGAFSGIDLVSFDYPHPAMGPVFSSDEPGDTYPFGGTTVGRVDFACYSVTTCRVTTGRFADYQALLDYFADVLDSPITDNAGVEITSGVALQQYCYDYWNITSEAEVSFVGDLDFKETASGFEADWSMLHSEFHPGMTIWAFMDTPAYTADVKGRGVMSTCNSTSGREVEPYGEAKYFEGVVYSDVLNQPSLYIGDGDWVSSGVQINAESESVTVTLDTPIEY